MSAGGDRPAGPDHGRRLQALRSPAVDARLDGYLISHGPNVRYLSGFSGSSALLLVRPEEAALVTDARYAEQAGAEVAPEVTVHVRKGSAYAALASVLRDGRRGLRLGFEDAHLTVADRARLEEACEDVAWKPAGDPVGTLRSVKERAEIRSMARAARLADGALAALLPEIRPGMTEREVAARLEYLLRLQGSDPVPFETIVASGPRTSLPHARPSARRIEAGDLLLLDFGASVHGYASDITRTFVVGPASDWQWELHAAVSKALEAALAVLRAGAPARDVDRAARTSLEADGLGDAFGHGTGHGIGLEVHEVPGLNSRSDDVLREGNVVTVEPGAYLPGRGGVRIEDDVLVEAKGGRVLTHAARELLEL
ncbi:MAG: M24 family metallopeptidase [Gemmatimonadota bacterium]